MFDNTFVYLQTILDSKKEPVQDNVGDPLQSREYNGLLAKFLEGIPDSFQVDSWLRDNSSRKRQKTDIPRKCSISGVFFYFRVPVPAE